MRDRGRGRTRTIAAAALCLVACATVARAAEPLPVPAIEWNPRQYVCCRAIEPIELDGRLFDRAWGAAEWTEDFVDIEGPGKPAPRFQTRAKMLWDDDCLYIGAHLEEKDVWATLRERDSVIFQDNDFEVFIDPDGDTHEYYELEVNAFGTDWDLLLVKPYRDGGPAVNAWDIRDLRSGAHVIGTLNEPWDTDKGWSVEIAIPWSVLAECAHRDAPPKPGDEWRVNFSRVEWQVQIAEGGYAKKLDPATGKPFPEDNWVWSPQGLVNMHYPEMWGIVRFSDAEGKKCEETFVRDPRHEDAWALRRVYYAERNWRAAHGGFTGDLTDLGLDLGESYAGRVSLGAGPHWFVATLSLPDGGALHIREDGRLW